MPVPDNLRFPELAAKVIELENVKSPIKFIVVVNAASVPPKPVKLIGPYGNVVIKTILSVPPVIK